MSKSITTFMDGEDCRDCETLEKRIGTLRAQRDKLFEALKAFADHFGPLEDNRLLNDECRHCFRLAREAIRKAGGA